MFNCYISENSLKLFETVIPPDVAGQKVGAFVETLREVTDSLSAQPLVSYHVVIDVHTEAVREVRRTIAHLRSNSPATAQMIVILAALQQEISSAVSVKHPEYTSLMAAAQSTVPPTVEASLRIPLAEAIETVKKVANLAPLDEEE